jgi:hypothetical protein
VHVPTILAGSTISSFGQGSRCISLNGSIGNDDEDTTVTSLIRYNLLPICHALTM